MKLRHIFSLLTILLFATIATAVTQTGAAGFALFAFVGAAGALASTSVDEPAFFTCVAAGWSTTSCVENIGGIKRLWVCDSTDITSWTSDGSGGYNALVMVATKVFYEIELEEERSNYNETKTSGRRKGTYTARLSFVPKGEIMSQALTEYIMTLIACCDLSVIFEDNNSNLWVLGDEVGARAYVVDNVGESGTSKDDDNVDTTTLEARLTRKARAWSGGVGAIPV